MNVTQLKHLVQKQYPCVLHLQKMKVKEKEKYFLEFSLKKLNLPNLEQHPQDENPILLYLDIADVNDSWEYQFKI